MTLLRNPYFVVPLIAWGIAQVAKVTDGSGHDHIKIDGKDPSVSATVNANNSSAALGLTVDNTTNNTPAKTDLLDLLNTKLGGGGATGGANGPGAPGPKFVKRADAPQPGGGKAATSSEGAFCRI